jgi:hypothetical protein
MAMVADLIIQRRKQILIHSIIYYRFNESVVSDQQWSEWALELHELQTMYPDIASQCFLAEEFKNFDPCSGYDLPLELPWAVEKAKWVMEYGDSRGKHGPL